MRAVTCSTTYAVCIRMPYALRRGHVAMQLHIVARRGTSLHVVARICAVPVAHWVAEWPAAPGLSDPVTSHVPWGGRGSVALRFVHLDTKCASLPAARWGLITDGPVVLQPRPAQATAPHLWPGSIRKSPSITQDGLWRHALGRP